MRLAKILGVNDEEQRFNLLVEAIAELHDGLASTREDLMTAMEFVARGGRICRKTMKPVKDDEGFIVAGGKHHGFYSYEGLNEILDDEDDTRGDEDGMFLFQVVEKCYLHLLKMRISTVSPVPIESASPLEGYIVYKGIHQDSETRKVISLLKRLHWGFCFLEDWPTHHRSTAAWRVALVKRLFKPTEGTK